MGARLDTALRPELRARLQAFVSGPCDGSLNLAAKRLGLSRETTARLLCGAKVMAGTVLVYVDRAGELGI